MLYEQMLLKSYRVNVRADTYGSLITGTLMARPQRTPAPSTVLLSSDELALQTTKFRNICLLSLLQEPQDRHLARNVLTFKVVIYRLISMSQNREYLNAKRRDQKSLKSGSELMVKVKTKTRRLSSTQGAGSLS